MQLDSDLIGNSYSEPPIVNTTEKEDVDNNEKTMCTKNDKGRVFTTPVCCKSMIKLAKALKERLTDSQINLKPFASTIISCLLISQVLFRLSLVKFCVHP